MQTSGVGRGKDVGGEFSFGREAVEPLAFDEPVLITTLFPFVEMVWLEILAVFTEAFDDAGVGDAVQEPIVDLITNVFWEPGDFAVAAIAGAEGGVGRGWISGLLDFWIAGLWRRVAGLLD